MFFRLACASSSASPAWRLVASSASLATMGLVASALTAAPPPALAMRAATCSNGSSPVVPIAARTSSAIAA